MRQWKKSRIANKYHSKKNDGSKVVQILSIVVSLQKGDQSVISYAIELSTIFSELDHYQPYVHITRNKEYILMDWVYKILWVLRPKFEGIRWCSVTIIKWRK